MRSGGQTTVIQRILERRAEKPPEIQEDTSATIAVMLRVVPPPRALLMFENESILNQLEDLVTSDVLDLQVTPKKNEAVRAFKEKYRPVIITDNHKKKRKLRALQTNRAPYILYVSEIDE